MASSRKSVCSASARPGRPSHSGRDDPCRGVDSAVVQALLWLLPARISSLMTVKLASNKHSLVVSAHFVKVRLVRQLEDGRLHGGLLYFFSSSYVGSHWQSVFNGLVVHAVAVLIHVFHVS